MTIVFLGIAFCFAATTLCAIVNFGWRQPMFDQYRSYAAFLSLPFPQNILQLDNGHRPIIPNLFRLAEIHWFAANQVLQIFIGTSCAFFSATLIAVSAWRTRELPLVARAAGVMLAVLGLLWLANARMLLHGNESLHAYLLVLAVVCAALCTHQASRRNSPRWLGAASAACVVATFCFGPGIASFAAVMVLALLLRLPVRWLLLPIGTLAACLILYLFVLPGDQGVRGMLELHPLDSAKVATQWLSSPWINGWLGSADPQASWVPVNRASWYGAALAASANAVVSASHIDWRTLGILIGVAGTGGFLARTLRSFLSTRRPSSLEVLATGIGFFALASAAIIGIGRLEYIRQNVDQVFADRYLIWPSLFWSAFALLLLVDVARSRNRPLQFAGLAFLVALPIVMFPTHRAWTGWGATVYQGAQQTAAAVRSGVLDGDLLPDDDAANRATRIQTLNLMRQQRLAMFANPAWELVGSHWSGSVQRSDEYAADAHIVGAVADLSNAQTALHFNGWIGRGIAALQQCCQLAVLDDTGTVAGLAEFSFIKPGAVSLRLNLPRKRGFDGYIKNYHADRIYTLVSLDVANSRATELATLRTAGVSAAGRAY